MEDTLIILNIEELSLTNDNFRKVISTTKEMQVVAMSLQPGEEIGLEKHEKVTQFIRIEKGKDTIDLGPSHKEINLF